MRVQITDENKSKDRKESVWDQVKLSKSFEMTDNIEKRVYLQDPDYLQPIGEDVAYCQWDDDTDYSQQI